MTWRPTEFEDLHRISLPDDPPEFDVRSLMPDTLEARRLLRDNARTWEEDHRPLAIVGVEPQWKGVGTVWTLLTADSKRRGVVLSLGVVRCLNMLQRDWGYWRLQATVVEGDEAARLWIVGLGFSFEGLMRCYGPDMQTHALYARLVV